jgi:integrase
MNESVQWKCIKRAGREHLVMRYRLPPATAWREMSTGCRTLREAEKWASKRVRAIEEGEFERTGWAAFKERYRKDHLSGLAPKTQEAFTTATTMLERLCRFEAIEDITADLLVRFAGKLRAAGKAEATVDAYRSHILAALSWAASIKMIRSVPVLPRVRRARNGTQSRGRPLTREEIERMAICLPEIVGERFAKRWAWNIEALSRSGMRLGETFQLHWEPGDWHYIDRLDAHRPRLVISAASEKGFRDRILPITPDFAAQLRDVPRSRRRGRVIKWVLSRGETNCMKTVSKRISAIGTAAGVVVGTRADGSNQFASAHDFRRTFALRWAPQVMPIVLKDLMRHSSLETTLRYYVGLNADRMGDALWSTAESGDILGDMLDSLFSVDHSGIAGIAANHGDS